MISPNFHVILQPEIQRMSGKKDYIYKVCATLIVMLFTRASLYAQTTSLEEDERKVAVSVTDSLLSLHAQPIEFNDTATVEMQATDSVQKKLRFGKRLINFFFKANTPDPNKRVDFGFLPGPHYSSTQGLGLGIMATATYSMDRTDPTLTRSNASLFSDMTTKGFLLIGLKGNNFFPKERFRLDYRAYIYTFPTNFWGIGYANGNNDDNETNYRRNRVDLMGRFLFRMARNTYIGPMLNFRYIKALEVSPGNMLTLFNGQDLTVHSQTAGFSFIYDSRDFMLNAYRGWFVQLDQTFTPRFLGNDYCFSTTDLTVSTYRKVWKGGVLAGELHGGFNYGNPAWCLMSEVGGNSRMRGYFEGRYRDKNIIEAQVELRQRIKKRHGAVVWVGAAEVFPRFDAMRWKRILPNVGLGYRWEFKQRINVRLDCGWSKNGPGFMFNINEAF